VGYIRLSAAQAARLGVKTSSPPRRTRRTAPAKECLDNRCVACQEVFKTTAAEERHFKDNPTHTVYETVIQLERKTDDRDSD
jgi:hypothetical protein